MSGVPGSPGTTVPSRPSSITNNAAAMAMMSVAVAVMVAVVSLGTP